MTSRELSIVSGALLGVLLAASGAWAQPRPGTAQPGQVERQLQRPPEPTAQPGAITIPGTGQQAPPNAEEIRFVLTALTIDGVTVYPADKLRPLYANALNREVTLGEIYRIVDALTARYRNDGYILSQVIVPAQSVDSGVVRLQAVEGYVGNVQVEGGTDALRARARKYAERIRASRPLTAAALERNVLLLNDLPGIQARAILSTGDQPGAADLTLRLEESRVRVGAAADSLGSQAQGRQRAFGDIDLHSLIGASLTEVRAVSTLNRELIYGAVAHDQFIGTQGSRISVEGSYVYSEPQDTTFIPLHLTTRSTTGTVTYSVPVIRRRSHNLYVRGLFSAFDSQGKIFGFKDTDDRLRAIRVGATLDAVDGLRGVSIIDIEYSQGLKGLGASKEGDEFLSTPNGKPDFRKIVIYGARSQALPGNLSLTFAVDGQYAFTDLLAPELFAYGGELFGRGYDPSELLGEHGAAAKLDVAYTHSWNGRFSLSPFVFGDAGRVWIRTPLPGIPTQATATSAGAGLRVNVGNSVTGFVQVAKPLDRDVLQEGNRDARVFAGISIQ